MSQKKYKILSNDVITTDCGATLYRIQALKDFVAYPVATLNDPVEKVQNAARLKEGSTMFDVLADGDIEHMGIVVKAGDLGGYIEADRNLSQEGAAWVADQSKVFGYAQVLHDALVCGNSEVSEMAIVTGNALVMTGIAKGRAHIEGVLRSASMEGRAIVDYDSVLECDAVMKDNARLSDGSTACGFGIELSGNVLVTNQSQIEDQTKISGNVVVRGSVIGSSSINGATDEMTRIISSHVYDLTVNEPMVLENATYGQVDSESPKPMV